MPVKPGLQYTPFTSGEVDFLQTFAGVSYSEGDVLYINASGDVTNLGPSTSGQILTTQGTGEAPIWGAASTMPSFSDAEEPTGAVNGSNTDFTFNNTPSPAKSLILIVNGQVLTPGGEDYTLSGQTATVVTAPPSGSVVRGWYRY